LKSKKITFLESEKQSKPEFSLISLNKMSINYDSDLRISTVKQLVEEEIIFVEDGNHGGNRPLKHEFVLDGIPFVRIPDLKNGKVDLDNCDRINETAFNRIRKGIGQGGDIVLTHRATVGKIAITNINDPVFVTNPGTTVWRSTNPEILDRFYLYYFMQSSIFMEQLSAQVGNNSTFDYVSLTQQRDLLIAFPTIQKQHVIVHHLIMLDKKIRQNQQMIKTLEEIIKSIFKSWFIDFDGVIEFEDSELGKIPKSSKIKKLGDFAEINNGFVFKSGDFVDDGVFLLRTRNFSKTGYVVKNNDDVYLPLDFYEKFKKFQLKQFDILLVMVGASIGNLGFVTSNALPSLQNQNMWNLRSKEQEQQFFLKHLIKIIVNENMCTAIGSARDFFRKDYFKNIKFIEPCKEEIFKFNNVATSIYKKIDSVIGETDSLMGIRTSLLSKLISGEIRV
jgi:type I restriction enzyme, S subunit